MSGAAVKASLGAAAVALLVGLGGLLTAPRASADGTITDMVDNTGAREMPFWAYLYDNGFGYLQTTTASREGKVVCANRQAGVPNSQIVGLLQTRGLSLNEAQAIVIATDYESNAHPFCTD